MIECQGRKRLNTNGFTLIEVLVTLAILGIVIIPLSGLFVQAIKVNGDAKERLIATQIAQQYLERNKSKSGELLLSTKITTETQDSVYPEYHVQVVTEPYKTAARISPAYDYRYGTESDVLPDIDMKVVFNDDSTDIAATDRNHLIITKEGETTAFFSMVTGTSDGVLNVVINGGKTTPDVTFRGSLSGDSTVLEDETKACTLANSQFSTNRVENIRVEINTNKNLTINVTNFRTINMSDECNVYVVHKSGKTGKVTGNVLGGKVDFIDNLYDKTIISGMPEQGLYKITVIVFKGTDSTTGRRVYRLDSFLK